MVDFVGKVENFDEDFKTVCDRLGLGYKYKTQNVGSDYDYREFYDEQTYEIVTKRCKWDIETFGYKFEEG